MDREEILARSRAENKNRDVYEQEVLKQSQGTAILFATVLATLFVVVQIFAGGGLNTGMYAIVAAFSMGTFWVKWWKLRRRHELLMALTYTVIVLVFSADHICRLIGASAAL